VFVIFDESFSKHRTILQIACRHSEIVIRKSLILGTSMSLLFVPECYAFEVGPILPSQILFNISQISPRVPTPTEDRGISG
jgi:hypothetical protein